MASYNEIPPKRHHIHGVDVQNALVGCTVRIPLELPSVVRVMLPDWLPDEDELLEWPVT